MEWSLVLDNAPRLAAGLVRTLELCALAALASLLIGAVLTAAHLRGGTVLRYLASFYTALCLGLPLLIIIYILFYALPVYGLTLSPEVVGVCALAIYYGPYVAEVVRGAILALPVGQFDAATSIGLPLLRTVWRIMLPQALPLMLPPLVGLMIGLIKDSALLSVVSVPEFMFFAKQAVSDTYAPIEIYVTVAITYWVLNASCAAVANWMERRLTRFSSGHS